MTGYNLRKKGDTLLKVMTTEEIMVKLRELEPAVRKAKEEMEKQLRVDPDIMDFRFTV